MTKVTAATLRRWWVALALFTVLLRLPALLHPRQIDDEAVYAVVAVEIVEGGKPYVDAVERKPPLLFWTYSLVVALGGAYNWYALHLACAIWTLLTMAAIYALTARLFEPRAGLVAAALYSLYVPWATWKNLAFNGEVLMNLPIACAFLLTLRPSSSRTRPELVLAGALLAAAFLLKQPGAIAAVPAGIYLLLPSYRRVRGLGLGHSLLHAGSLTLGFWLTLAGVAAVLWQQGILTEAYFWTITDHDVPHGISDPVFWVRGGRMTLAFVGACAPLVIGSAIVIRERWDGAAERWRGKEAEFVALALLLVASVIGTAASGRFYPHYFIQAVLPLSILAAPVIAEVLANRRTRHLRWLSHRVIGVWLGLTAVGFLTAHAIGLSRQRQEMDVGRYAREQTSADARIFVWGQATGVYCDAQRRPASRYIATFPLTGYIFGSPLSWDPTHDTAHRIVSGSWESFLADVRAHPPTLIIDVDAARRVPRYPIEQFPILAELVASEYELVYRGREGHVYRRRG